MLCYSLTFHYQSGERSKVTYRRYSASCHREAYGFTPLPHVDRSDLVSPLAQLALAAGVSHLDEHLEGARPPQRGRRRVRRIETSGSSSHTDLKTPETDLITVKILIIS